MSKEIQQPTPTESLLAKSSQHFLEEFQTLKNAQLYEDERRIYGATMNRIARHFANRQAPIKSLDDIQEEMAHDLYGEILSAIEEGQKGLSTSFDYKPYLKTIFKTVLGVDIDNDQQTLTPFNIPKPTIFNEKPIRPTKRLAPHHKSSGKTPTKQQKMPSASKTPPAIKKKSPPPPLGKHEFDYPSLPMGKYPHSNIEFEDIELNATKRHKNGFILYETHAVRLMALLLKHENKALKMIEIPTTTSGTEDLSPRLVYVHIGILSGETSNQPTPSFAAALHDPKRKAELIGWAKAYQKHRQQVAQAKYSAIQAANQQPAPA